MRSRIITGAAVLAAMALGGAGIATASSGRRRERRVGEQRAAPLTGRGSTRR